MPSSERILIVEDHADIVEILEFNLSQKGYELEVARDGEEGLTKALLRPPSLIVLDLMLPRMSGQEVCRRLKHEERTRYVPIIMLTAKSGEEDVTAGLSLGADDYVTKPFSPKELVARIQAVLRRVQHTPEGDGSRFRRRGELTVDLVGDEVWIGKERLALTKSEYGILAALISEPGRIFSREDLLEKIHGPKISTMDRSVDVHVASLRKKLKRHGDLIVTVRGEGYQIESE